MSPALMEFFVQPFLSKIAGGPSSISQFATLPSEPFTSINRRACGLIQSSLVSEPVRLMGLLASNSAAKEWCAKTGAAAATISAAAMIHARLIFIVRLLSILAQSFPLPCIITQLPVLLDFSQPFDRGVVQRKDDIGVILDQGKHRLAWPGSPVIAAVEGLFQLLALAKTVEAADH